MTSTIVARICETAKSEHTQVWQDIRKVAAEVVAGEEHLAALLNAVVMQRRSFAESLAARLSMKLAREEMGRDALYAIMLDVFESDATVTGSAAEDLLAIMERDPACEHILEPLLCYKGFLGLTTHRVAHALWNRGRHALAKYFQSINSDVHAMDIHPAACMGCGIFIDHATSLVIGETSIVEDDVSILHEVTLGGTGKEHGARHPIVRSGVLIGAGAKILGRVEIGSNAKIGAGSVVLDHVKPHTTVAGVPAVMVGNVPEDNPAREMLQDLECCRIESGMI